MMNNKNLDVIFFKIGVNFLEKILNEKEIKNELNESLGKEYDLIFNNKSIDFIVFNHFPYLENSYKVTIEIINKENIIGEYILYLNEKGGFIDEFFIIN